ncbi:MAG: transposon-encoded TnpW family protein [Eubacterium sp.]|nr:transposon-encoded TnpW family protein [Eubacterium sp.]
MTETKGEEKITTQTEPSDQPILPIRVGKTTYTVRLHFSENSRETMEEKVKKLIRRDIQEENF